MVDSKIAETLKVTVKGLYPFMVFTNSYIYSNNAKQNEPWSVQNQQQAALYSMLFWSREEVPFVWIPEVVDIRVRFSTRWNGW